MRPIPPVVGAIIGRNEEDEKTRRIYIHERMLEAFISDWAPEDRADRSQFCAQLTNIVRQVSADAQQPIMDQYLKIMAMIPVPPFMGGNK